MLLLYQNVIIFDVTGKGLPSYIRADSLLPIDTIQLEGFDGFLLEPTK